MNTNLGNAEESIDLDTKISLVKNQACFKKLFDDEVAEVANLFTEQTVIAGETIVTKGDPIDCIYLILKGTCDVLDSTVENSEIKWTSVATLSQGDAIGLSEVGLYSLSGKRTATVIALTDMVLLKLRVAVFHGIALAHAHIGEEMRKAQKNVVK